MLTKRDARNHSLATRQVAHGAEASNSGQPPDVI
jgi:hypothetical protein